MGEQGASCCLVRSARSMLWSLPSSTRIPPGVWHADQNFGSSEAMVMNFPTRPYNRAHPDKHRLDPHSNAIPFDWALRDG